MTKDTITFTLNGDVTLDDFSVAVTEFQKLINGLKEDIAPKKKIEWRIIGLEAGSATATTQGIVEEEKDLSEVEEIVEACMDVGRCVQQKRPLSYPTTVQNAARKFFGLVNGRISSARFENIETDVEIFSKPKMAERLTLTEQLKANLGAIRGRIQSISNRGQLRFALYDLIDDRAVSCYLAFGSEEIMRNAWGKIAMVEGMVRRDPETGRATTVRGVKEIRIIRECQPGEWREALGAAPNFLGDDLPEDVIRRARDV